MLEADPRGISTTSDTRMEVLGCLRREMPPDYLERNYIRLRGCVILEFDTGYDMECGTSPGNGSPPYAGRMEKNRGGNPKRDDREGKFLADETGWNSGPPTRR